MVEVRATGVNPSDIKNVLGLFPYTTTPRVPGRDFVDVVVERPEELLGKAVWTDLRASRELRKRWPKQGVPRWYWPHAVLMLCKCCKRKV